MAYELACKIEGQMLVAEITGSRPASNLDLAAKQVWQSIAEATRESNLDRILILSSATGQYPTVDAYRINSTLEDCGVQRGWSIAFVCLWTESLQELEFGETVATNRGFTVRVFSREDDARSWLTTCSDTPPQKIHPYTAKL